MEPQPILEMMRRFFAEKDPPVPPHVMESFPEQSPSALLKESLDVVDFIVYLEEELGRPIDVSQLGGAMMDSNFGELSVEVSRMLSEDA